MSDPYVGEIRMFAGNYAPVGWALCNGALLPIDENDTLFNLIGTTYGGDGQSTFAVPDLRGRVPLHAGNSTGPGLSQYTLGQPGGVESVTLTQNQMPAHSHALYASNDAATNDYTAANGVPGNTGGTNVYGLMGSPGPMMPNAIGAVGANQPHDNMAPYLCVNFIISLFGIYPMPT
jgi:microcystin-dependent protein